jgi:hypothetical protein
MPHGYVVTLDREGEDRYHQLGLTPIFTDATYFLSVLKWHVVDEGDMLPDTMFDEVASELERVLEVNGQMWESIDIAEFPTVLYAASYQDGLLHAFERMLILQNTGHYSHSCNVRQTLRGYEELRKEKVKSRRYHDVAYIEGYMNGHLYLLTDQETRAELPLYHVFVAKDQPMVIEDYLALQLKAASLHKSAYKYARQMVEENGYRKGIIVRHTPFLF